MFKLARTNYTIITERSAEQWRHIYERVNTKIKGTIVEKWVNYWKQIVKDYKDVTISLKQEIKEKPLKSTLYFTLMGSLGVCAMNNPNLQSFRAKYIESANELALVNSSVANPDSITHLKYIERCFNANLIRYRNLGIASIIWVDDFSSDCNTYESNCSYLQVPYINLTKHILDIGFLNIWWNTSKKMLDYDVNY